LFNYSKSGNYIIRSMLHVYNDWIVKVLFIQRSRNLWTCNPTRTTDSIYLWLYSPCGPWPLFQFLNLYTVGRTPWTGVEPVARPLPIQRTTQTQNKRTQTSMPRVGFKPTIPVFEGAKMIHTLDRTAVVIDKYLTLVTLKHH
jgi:hypothetical protein